MMGIQINNLNNGSVFDSIKIATSKSQKFVGDMSSASCEADKQDNGEVLGLTMVKEEGTNNFWGIKANYADESTDANPIVQVTTNYGGISKTYNVKINEVDPQNASKLEMFALCSYADDKGIGDNSTFGTYQTLKVYEDMSYSNDYTKGNLEEANSWEFFQGYKMNWNTACKSVLELVYNCKDIALYNRGIKLMSLFSKYPIL